MMQPTWPMGDLHMGSVKTASSVVAHVLDSLIQWVEKNTSSVGIVEQSMSDSWMTNLTVRDCEDCNGPCIIVSEQPFKQKQTDKQIYMRREHCIFCGAKYVRWETGNTYREQGSVRGSLDGRPELP